MSAAGLWFDMQSYSPVISRTAIDRQINHFNPAILSLSKIVKRLFPDVSITSASDLSKVLSEIFHAENADAQFENFEIQALRTLDLLKAKNITRLDDRCIISTHTMH